MPDVKYQSNNGQSSDFLRVLEAVRKAAIRDTHVASLGEVAELGDSIKCRLFPVFENEQEKCVMCEYLENMTFDVGDIVLILYLDRDFRQNLKQIRLSQQRSKQKKSSEYHSEMYGIIIGKVKSSVSDDIE